MKWLKVYNWVQTPVLQKKEEEIEPFFNPLYPL
jgi:hypothetical protein